MTWFCPIVHCDISGESKLRRLTAFFSVLLSRTDTFSRMDTHGRTFFPGRTLSPGRTRSPGRTLSPDEHSLADIRSGRTLSHGRTRSHGRTYSQGRSRSHGRTLLRILRTDTFSGRTLLARSLSLSYNPLSAYSVIAGCSHKCPLEQFRLLAIDFVAQRVNLGRSPTAFNSFLSFSR